MIVIIAEKPSVGREIARVLNITGRGEGYLHGKGYAVTWAFGHLLSLALPVDYGFEKPKAADLPVIPSPFRLIVRRKKTGKSYTTDTTAKRQLKVIKKLFDECRSIIVATDAGREGELIFRFIYEFTSCKKPFQRLWISSLTDLAIRDGFENLRPGEEFDDLYRAADCRAKADWLVGINASQALRIATGMGNNSLGRVQTPTLAMVCARWIEHKEFKPGEYWKVALLTGGDNQYRLTSVRDFKRRNEADALYEAIKQRPELLIDSVQVKTSRRRPPLLYDLTSLQKDASTHYGLTAERTLEIAQQLYEHKLITYPRTGSRYIPDDVMPLIPDLLYRVLQMPEFLSCSEVARPCNGSVDGSKVTDHHALLTTGLDPASLDGERRKVYCLIAGRMLEAFSSDCIKEVTTLGATCCGEKFAASSSRVLSPGWRAVYGRTEDADPDEDAHAAPPPEQGALLPVASHSVIIKTTHPKPLYTEASLLTAMENAGAELSDKAQREAMQGMGLGTPATRAAIISTLVLRDYIRREGKTIVPSDKGLALYKAVKAMKVADAELTGSWEKALGEIGGGRYAPDTFMQAIEVYTRQITGEVLSIKVEDLSPSPVFSCPKCGEGRVTLHNKIARCNGVCCGLVVFRTFLNKSLTDEHFEELFTTGRTSLIRGFEGKYRKKFSARIVFDEKFHATFEYPEPKPMPRTKNETQNED